MLHVHVAKKIFKNENLHVTMVTIEKKKPLYCDSVMIIIRVGPWASKEHL